jgi:hypothetical protein
MFGNLVPPLTEPEAERPTDAELLDMLADHYDVEPEEVLRWLGTFDPQAALCQMRLALGTSLEN